MLTEKTMMNINLRGYQLTILFSGGNCQQIVVSRSTVKAKSWHYDIDFGRKCKFNTPSHKLTICSKIPRPYLVFSF